MLSSVLIAGVAGDIGSAVAGLLRRRGVEIIGLDIKEPVQGFNAPWITADLTNLDEDGVQNLRSKLPTSLDGLISLIGGPEIADLASDEPERVTLDVCRRSLELNLVSQFALLKATLPILRENAPSSVALTSSVNVMGGYGAPAYSMAKAGLSGLVRALAVPLGRDDVSINALALGTTPTKHSLDLASAVGRNPGERGYGFRFPRDRPISISEAASSLVHLISGEFPVTGQVIVADAGQTLKR